MVAVINRAAVLKQEQTNSLLKATVEGVGTVVGNQVAKLLAAAFRH